jgi:hypothetical protein
MVTNEIARNPSRVSRAPQTPVRTVWALDHHQHVAVVFNTDQGSQFTGDDFTKVLKDVHGLRITSPVRDSGTKKRVSDVLRPLTRQRGKDCSGSRRSVA